MKKIRTAFSLIELSIVVLVIGILIAGIVQGSKLYDKFKIQTARQLTRSSPVNGIKDLVLWYETSLEESFSNSSGAIVRNITDGTSIDRWNDINPQKTLKLNATASGSARPIYKESVINNLPAVTLDGVNDRMNFDATSLINSQYSFFVVEQRTTSNIAYFISGSGTVNNSKITLGYDSSTTVRFGHYSNFLNFTVPSYIAPIPRIHFFGLNNVGKRYFLNTTSTSPSASDSDSSKITTFPNSNIGARSDNGSNSNFYKGDICEIIIFNRYLTHEERIAIFRYLSQKYKIAIR